MATTYAPGNWNYTPPSVTGTTAGQNIYNTTWGPNMSAPAVTPSTYGDLQGTASTGQWGRSYGQSPSVGQPIFDVYNTNLYSNPSSYDTLNRYLSTYYWPQYEAQQNAYQWGSEFDEAARRYDMDYGQQSAMNQYGMDLQTRQQQAAEWEANQAAQQWGQQFDWTKQQDQWTQQFSQQQLAQQLQELRLRLAAEQAVANTSAYGRAEKPNARFLRNWGN